MDHEGAEHNANLIWQYFQQNPTVPATVANIYALVEQKKNEFIWRTPLQQECDKHVARMSEQDRRLILNFISRRGLKDSGDDLLVNFNAIASYCLQSNIPVATNTLDMA